SLKTSNCDNLEKCCYRIIIKYDMRGASQLSWTWTLQIFRNFLLSKTSNPAVLLSHSDILQVSCSLDSTKCNEKNSKKIAYQ
ncbi:MAG: hypothetical protein LHW47_04715, partial [Candidatus Cloacimonetes bacterium]|nr:hypothetical protein [Candidatus Cloacimonadota bacterium]